MVELAKSQMAELLDVTPRTLSTWQTEPDFPPPERRGRTNNYDAAAVVAWWRAREIARLIEGDDGELLDLNQERARLAKVQTSRQQLLLARERGEVVAVADVAEAVGGQLSNVRARLLSIPSTCASNAFAAETPAEARLIIETAIHDALAELSADKPAEDMHA